MCNDFDKLQNIEIVPTLRVKITLNTYIRYIFKYNFIEKTVMVLKTRI